METKRFNEQDKRNAARFPSDFMFQLTTEENDSLRPKIATLKTGRGQHRKYLPYVFTEHGAIMAAMVQGSPRAVEVSENQNLNYCVAVAGSKVAKFRKSFASRVKN